MKTYINIIALLIAFNFAQAQDIQYVSAENGLVVRNSPNRGAKRVTKLDYGTQIEVLEHSNLKLDVKDNNEIVSGEWVKIKTNNDYKTTKEGYVFNGFLTKKELKQRFKISFDEFIVTIDSLNAYPIESIIDDKKNSVSVGIELGETPEGKTIRIKHLQDYSKIQIFQKHENSISIMNEDPHCDLVNWKHYTSSWKPLKSISKNHKFITISYSENDWNEFTNVNIDELKDEVKKTCGEEWSNLIKDTKSLNDYPIGISISKIFLRIVMTDLDGDKIEKIIAFEIPMGC